jgi:uncharacterized protein YbdZ (MbtH family)
MSSANEEREDKTIYKVVVNHEEQYSIWPADRDSPLGWSEVGRSGSKDECLSYIKEVWTDMRPLSLRKRMEEAAARAEHQPVAESSGNGDEDRSPRLVERLSQGNHPLELSLRPEKTVKAFKESVDRGYVLLKFPNTRGATELGVKLDPERADLSQGDFENQDGSVHLEGSLTLDYVKLRCLADIDLKTLSGHGHLEPVDA